MTSASLLIVLFVGTVVGALTGLVLGLGSGALVLAIVAGFVACLVALVVRHFLLNQLAGVGRDDTKTPGLVIIYAIIASLAGSLAAKEVSDFSEIAAPTGIGSLAGLFSTLLLAMLLITYHTYPGHPPTLMKR